MRQQELGFHSDGLKLDGTLYLPDEREPQANAPLVLVCSGFTGLKEIHPARFARALTARGYSCYGFDYRGFGASEGTRGRVLCEEQVRDITNAVARLRAHGPTAWRPLVLLGWGMAGGLVLEAATLVRDQLGGIIAANGFYDAQRVQRAVRGADGLTAFLRWSWERRIEAVRSSEEVFADPFYIYPLDTQSRTYVDSVLRKVPGYGDPVNLSFGDSLLRFRPEAWVESLDALPLLIAHGAENRLHPPEEADSLERRYPGPCQKVLLEGAGHTEWMLDDHPTFRSLVSHIDGWLRGLA